MRPARAHPGLLESASLLGRMDAVAPLLVEAQTPAAGPYAMVLLGQPSEIGPRAGVECLRGKHRTQAYETPPIPRAAGAPPCRVNRSPTPRSGGNRARG